MSKSLVARPQEPSGDSAVVRFTKWNEYTYAAIKSPNGLWFTAQNPNRVGGQKLLPMLWDDFLDKVVRERNWGTLEELE